VAEKVVINHGIANLKSDLIAINLQITKAKNLGDQMLRVLLKEDGKRIKSKSKKVILEPSISFEMTIFNKYETQNHFKHIGNFHFYHFSL